MTVRSALLPGLVPGGHGVSGSVLASADVEERRPDSREQIPFAGGLAHDVQVLDVAETRPRPRPSPSLTVVSLCCRGFGHVACDYSSIVASVEGKDGRGVLKAYSFTS